MMHADDRRVEVTPIAPRPPRLGVSLREGKDLEFRLANSGILAETFYGRVGCNLRARQTFAPRSRPTLEHVNESNGGSFARKPVVRPAAGLGPDHITAARQSAAQDMPTHEE